jgi:hypothetical protein
MFGLATFTANVLALGVELDFYSNVATKNKCKNYFKCFNEKVKPVLRQEPVVRSLFYCSFIIFIVDTFELLFIVK